LKGDAGLAALQEGEAGPAPVVRGARWWGRASLHMVPARVDPAALRGRGGGRTRRARAAGARWPRQWHPVACGSDCGSPPTHRRAPPAQAPYAGRNPRGQPGCRSGEVISDSRVPPHWRPRHRARGHAPAAPMSGLRAVRPDRGRSERRRCRAAPHACRSDRAAASHWERRGRGAGAHQDTSTL